MSLYENLTSGGPAPLPPLVVILVIAAWNIFAMAVVGWDKRAAQAGRSRIPERTLLGLAFAMGGPGVWLGMRVFRHKTRHMRFIVLVPVAFLLNLVIFRLLGNL